MRKENLHVLKVLDAMKVYLLKDDNNFHNQLSMVYCNNCKAIGSAGGDYTINVGRDCLGDNYKTKKAPEQCTKCDSNNFIKISEYDMSRLNEVYKERTVEIVIDGIKSGLEEMGFPNLYNKRLPKIADKWKRFGRPEKRKQINRLLREQKKLSVARKKVESLEEVLTV